MEYYSTQIYTSDGTLQEITVGFFYRSRDDIHVYIDGVPTDAWDWVGVTGSVIRLDSPVPAGEQLMVRRLTDLQHVPFVFGEASGARGNSEFSAQTLDDNFAYILEAAQEALDVFEIVGVNLGSVQLWLDQLQEAIDNIADTLAYMELLRDETQTAYDYTLAAEARALQAQLAALASQVAAETAQQGAAQSATTANAERLLTEAAAQAAAVSESAAAASASLASTRASEAEASRVAADNSASGAAASATSAASSASQAQGHATQAGTSASAASASETNAANSATAAESSKDEALLYSNRAQAWAENPEDTPVVGDGYSAYHWAQKAQAFAGGAGYLQKSYNLSDLDSVETARDNLGLGTSATRDVGTTSGTVAAGDDERITRAVTSRDYEAGIEITEYNQIVRDSNNEFWRLSGQVELPYTTTGDWGAEEGLFVAVGDAVLRQELANPDMGAVMVARGVVAVDSIADLLALPVDQRREDLRYLVKGYHAGADVGGGEFYYDPSRKNENDAGVVFDGFIRINTDWLCPEDFGATQGADDSIPLRRLFEWAHLSKKPVTGNNKTYEANAVILKSYSKIYDIEILHNKYDENINSVIQTEDGYHLKDVYLENVRVNGRRELHVNLPIQESRENGGRHAFAIRGRVDGLTMVRCKGNNSATDGLMLFPVGVGSEFPSDVINNIKLYDCEFNWNRRHGGGADRVNGFISSSTKWNHNGIDIDPSADPSSGLRGDGVGRIGIGYYGAGFDFEDYRPEDGSKNIVFQNSQGVGNARQGILILRDGDATETTEFGNYQILGGSYDEGIHTLEGDAIAITPNGQSPYRVFGKVVIKDVELNGSRILLRGTAAEAEGLIDCAQVVTLGNSFLVLDQGQSGYAEPDVSEVVYNLSFPRNLLRIEGGNLVRGNFDITTLTDTVKLSSSVSSFYKIQLRDGADNLRGGAEWRMTDTGRFSFNIINGLSGNEATVFTVGPTGSLTSGEDDGANIGSASLRYSQVYAATGTINTSDAREKQQVSNLSNAEVAVAEQLKGMVRKFKWNHAVESKGDGARWHFGVMAQEVKQAFEDHGLDAHDYGLFCYDEWYEGAEVIDEETGEIIKQDPNRERYGVRYDQLLAFIISVM